MVKSRPVAVVFEKRRTLRISLSYHINIGDQFLTSKEFFFLTLVVTSSVVVVVVVVLLLLLLLLLEEAADEGLRGGAGGGARPLELYPGPEDEEEELLILGAENANEAAATLPTAFVTSGLDAFFCFFRETLLLFGKDQNNTHSCIVLTRLWYTMFE